MSPYSSEVAALVFMFMSLCAAGVLIVIAACSLAWWMV